MLDEENIGCLYLQRCPYAEMWWERYRVLDSATSWSSAGVGRVLITVLSSARLENDTALIQ